MKTHLTDRTLWYDGDSVISNEHLLDLIINGDRDRLGDHLYVANITKDIDQYNQLQPPHKRIKQKTKLNPIELTWKTTEDINARFPTEESVNSYIMERFVTKCISDNIPESEIPLKIERLHEELTLYSNNGLYDVLRTLIHIIETFEQKNVVWGVGRGSCVSSYVLYVMGVHDVDSVKYGLDIVDFIKKPPITSSK